MPRPELKSYAWAAFFLHMVSFLVNRVDTPSLQEAPSLIWKEEPVFPLFIQKKELEGEKGIETNLYISYSYLILK